MVEFWILFSKQFSLVANIFLWIKFLWLLLLFNFPFLFNYASVAHLFLNIGVQWFPINMKLVSMLLFIGIVSQRIKQMVDFKIPNTHVFLYKFLNLTGILRHFCPFPLTSVRTRYLDVLIYVLFIIYFLYFGEKEIYMFMEGFINL